MEIDQSDSPEHRKMDMIINGLLSASGDLVALVRKDENNCYANPREYAVLSTDLALVRTARDELNEILNHFNVASPTRVVDLRRFG